jgi:A/G-specific adenine glycosylase
MDKDNKNLPQKYSINQFKKCYHHEGLTPHLINTFQKIIYDYYHQHGRTFPWRQTHNPYHILISEIMLQQTTTQRVQEKYTSFITHYPNFPTLAQAPLPHILTHWQGLGYNRRALHLKKIATIITKTLNNKLPSDEKKLQTLPGIGPYTAAAICAFAFNQPAILLETNIQSVYIHFFYDNQTFIKDTKLIPLIKKTLDTTNPRAWYYALMDYGVMIKKTHGNPSQKSAHYTKQQPFQNSNRQIRGLILKLLLENTTLTTHQLKHKTKIPPDRLIPLINQLQKEGFIYQNDKIITLAK